MTDLDVDAITGNARAARLVAAAIRYREAIRDGMELSGLPEFLDAVDGYLAGRNPAEERRDEFLRRYPTPDALAAAVRERLAARAPECTCPDPWCRIHPLSLPETP